MDSCQLWEVLVPQAFNSGETVPVTHHHAWDKAVRRIAGGLTILRSAKGVWESPSGDIFQEVMIPVRIACSEEQIRQIIAMTIAHYEQEAVLAYLISERELMVYRESVESRSSGGSTLSAKE